MIRRALMSFSILILVSGWVTVGPSNLSRADTAQIEAWYGVRTYTYHGYAYGGVPDTCTKKLLVNMADFGIHAGQIQGLERIDCGYPEDLMWDYVKLWHDTSNGAVLVASNLTNKFCDNVTTCFQSTPWHCGCGNYHANGRSQIRWTGYEWDIYTNLNSYQVSF